MGQLGVNFSKSDDLAAPPAPLVLPAPHCTILPCFKSPILFVWLIIARGTFFNRESYDRYLFVGKEIAIPMKVEMRHVRVIYLYRAGQGQVGVQALSPYLVKTKLMY